MFGVACMTESKGRTIFGFYVRGLMDDWHLDKQADLSDFIFERTGRRFDQSQISKMMRKGGGGTRPTPEFVSSLALAFDMSPREVDRLARAFSFGQDVPQSMSAENERFISDLRRRVRDMQDDDVPEGNGDDETTDRGRPPRR